MSISPAEHIVELDQALAENGEPAVVRRQAWAGTTKTTNDVGVQAFIRGYKPAEIVGGIVQGDSHVIMSPSEIVAAGWPGATPSDGTDGRVPVKGDKLIAAGRAREIMAPIPFYVAGELVRIELQVRG